MLKEINHRATLLSQFILKVLTVIVIFANFGISWLFIAIYVIIKTPILWMMKRSKNLKK